MQKGRISNPDLCHIVSPFHIFTTFMNKNTTTHTLLFANIGNRNISFQNKSFDKLTDDQKLLFGGSFKAFSQTILSDFEQFASELSVNIINQLLEALGNNYFDQVISQEL